jgi:hypothetical protein
MFRPPFVAISREVLTEGFVTKKSQKMYRHKILIFNCTVDTVRTADTTVRTVDTTVHTVDTTVRTAGTTVRTVDTTVRTAGTTMRIQCAL